RSASPHSEARRATRSRRAARSGIPSFPPIAYCCWEIAEKNPSPKRPPFPSLRSSHLDTANLASAANLSIPSPTISVLFPFLRKVLQYGPSSQCSQVSAGHSLRLRRQPDRSVGHRQEDPGSLLRAFIVRQRECQVEVRHRGHLRPDLHGGHHQCLLHCTAWPVRDSCRPGPQSQPLSRCGPRGPSHIL